MGLDTHELLHAKIIRDANKIDKLEINLLSRQKQFIIREKKKQKNNRLVRAEYQSFLNHEMILSSCRQNDLDIWLPHLVFVFDLNFKYSFQEVLKHQYIDNLYKRLDYQNIDTKKR